ncbi:MULTISPECIES: hypothetical protein [unclassified Methylobacterium]|jgi:hypothetical protein|uniref:hypothetical protein n=1 Tax=unclassified Methylobacterium TaxID=2615210 RepID=UPI0013554F81|nr:hypothetical protein [Methylobacterium sp. 2A]MWV24277.1 hypothetical protein [Methylobacterium sp. 2A]
MPQQQELARAGESQAVVLVKALPQAGGTHGETVCVAAITEYGQWLRLYPVTFRQLEQARQFGRWDRIRFKWRLPDRAKDRRIESRSVDPLSIEITGKLKDREKEGFLGNAIVSSTKREYEEGRSLALIRPENPVFFWKRRSQDDLEKVRQDYQRLQSTSDLFGGQQVVPREPAPYDFYYRYRDDDGEHEPRCHDWEIEATFLKRRRELGEQGALDWMMSKFGQEYPTKGMVLAMGTHSQRNWQWMIIGVVRLDPIRQAALF